MNPLQFREAISSDQRQVRVWDNAAFDDAHLQAISVNSSGEFEVDPEKENRAQDEGLKMSQEGSVDGKGIDEEIMEVEQEIKRLALRLHMLRAKKTKRVGRVVPAKFMPLPPDPAAKKAPKTPATKNLPTPGKRRVSVGAAEIAASVKSTTPGVQWKSSITTPKPRASISACTAVTESRMGRRGMSLGLSEMVSKLGTATMESLKSGERGESHLRPKALFQEEEGNEKRQVRSARARIVPSRYSIAVPRSAAGDEPGSKRRKWSLPELEKKENGGRGRRASIMTTSVAEALPRIKALRRTTIASPRDSGCVKRAADFAGRNPFFRPSGHSLDFD